MTVSGVVLTGDVHHTIPASDQSFVTSSEAELACTYARIAEGHGLKTTQFVTGRAAAEFTHDVRALASLENVAIGGHGWDAFHPQTRYRVMRRLSGSAHGPRAVQKWSVRKTRRALEAVTNSSVTTWRNHAYTHDTNTPYVLAAEGVDVWSDVVDDSLPGTYRHESGVVVLPINTTPDHERVLHGAQTLEAVGERRTRFMTIDQWCDQVAEQAARIASAGGVATILAHPICMQIADDWRSFERLCDRLSGIPSLWAHEVI
jgi:hypothetical protein